MRIERDSSFVVFPDPPDVLAAAAEGAGGLAQRPDQGSHGVARRHGHLADDEYVGEGVHKGARIAVGGPGP